MATMKERELREKGVCGICKQGVGHTQLPMFWIIKIQRWGLDLGAVQRQQALGMMLGGNGGLAQVMGPDEDMAKTITDVEITLCEECAMKYMDLMRLVEEIEGE